MIEKIYVNIDENHQYFCEDKIIARSGENECTQLEITLDECLSNYWVYIDFLKPDGTKFKTPKLDVTNNVVRYDIPSSLLNQKGYLQAQIILQDENGKIWKSTKKQYTIMDSINATDDIPKKEDFITEAQTLLSEIEEGLTPTIGENGNWFILNKDTGKTSVGEDGVGISSITEEASIENDGINKITVTFTDGTTQELTVKNGSKGETGDVNFATFEFDTVGNLIMNTDKEMDNCHFEINGNGELEVEIHG